MASLVVGVISDTHGLVRPEAVEVLRGCKTILHAGDVGTPEVLDALGIIAPVAAVRGNVDHGAWAERLPVVLRQKVGDLEVAVIHDLKQLRLDPTREGISVVVSGHSHMPHVRRKDGVLYINPGSAGPRRFHLPVGLALLRIGDDGRAEGELVRLKV